MRRYILQFFGLVGLFGYGSTIMCYECNSATNSMCLENDLPEGLRRNCSEYDRGVKHVLCRKITQVVEHGINGQLPASRVIRSCGWDDSKYRGVCYHRSGYGGKQDVCSCVTDFCNDAHTIFTPSSITTVLFNTVVLYTGKLMYT